MFCWPRNLFWLQTTVLPNVEIVSDYVEYNIMSFSQADSTNSAQDAVVTINPNNGKIKVKTVTSKSMYICQVFVWRCVRLFGV